MVASQTWAMMQANHCTKLVLIKLNPAFLQSGLVFIPTATGRADRGAQ